MIILYILIALVIGYFLGAIPFGKIYVKQLRGKDISEIGSGRSGGTNSMRAGGFSIGLMTGISDALKGCFALLLTRWVLTQFGADPATLPWLEVAAGCASVFGHNWSIFYGFKGGAGTGPNVGWAAALWPPMVPVAIVVMVFMIFIVGYASVGSFTMALIIPVSFAWLYFTGSTAVLSTPAYIVGGLVTLAFVTYALRPNFQRLWRGEERLVGIRAYMAKSAANAQEGPST